VYLFAKQKAPEGLEHDGPGNVHDFVEDLDIPKNEQHLSPQSDLQSEASFNINMETPFKAKTSKFDDLDLNRKMACQKLFKAPELDEDEDNQYLVDMRNKPPSPVVSRSLKRQFSAAFPPHVEPAVNGVDHKKSEKAEPKTKKIEIVGESIEDVLEIDVSSSRTHREPRTASSVFESVLNDIPLQSLRKFQVDQGVPRLFPANIFPGEPRKDSSYGGIEIKPTVVSDHVRRSDRGKGPLLCTKCSR
jgi:hypothetical protein